MAQDVKPIKVGMVGLGIGGGMILQAAERMKEVEIFAGCDEIGRAHV